MSPAPAAAAGAGRAAAAAEKVQSAAGTVAATRDSVSAASRPRGRRARRAAKGIGPAPDRALIAAVAILFSTGFLRYAIVDRGLPSRRWWVGTTITAALLSIATDVAPKGARYFSYMVILGAVIQNTVPIVEGLTQAEKEKASADAAAATGRPTIPASLRNPALMPVFLRSGGGGSGGSNQGAGNLPQAAGPAPSPAPLPVRIPRQPGGPLGPRPVRPPRSKLLLAETPTPINIGKEVL